jgi:hypothetical protein
MTGICAPSENGSSVMAAGGGFYSGFVALRIFEAWDLFGSGNGARTLEEMRVGSAGTGDSPCPNGRTRSSAGGSS